MSLLCESLPLKKMLASTATWQSLAGGDFDSAMEHVAIFFGEEEELPFPRAIIYGTTDGGSHAGTRVSMGAFSKTVILPIVFELEVDPSVVGDSPEQQGLWVDQQVGQIIQEMLEIATRHTQVDGEEPLYLFRYTSTYGPERVPNEERPFNTPDDLAKYLWVKMIEFEIH